MTFTPVATQNPAQPEPVFSASSTSDLAGELERLMPETPAAGLCSAEARAFHDAGQAWIFSVTRDRLTLGHAFGVVKRGRKRAELFVTLIQSAPGGEVFWIGLRNFVARQHITDLVVNCVALGKSGETIPAFSRETSRFVDEHLYVIELARNEGPRRLSSNNRRNIVRATKAGVAVINLTREQAVDTHFVMTGTSLSRREKRGESTALRSPRQNVLALLETQGAQLFQAALDGQVISSMLVFMFGRHGYYYDGGTSQNGMELGASHFLMNHIIGALKESGAKTLNMGIAASTNPGLIRYKEGFSPDVWIVQRVSSDQATPYKLIRNMATAWLR